MICLSWWALSILILRTQCRFIPSLPCVLNILLMKKPSNQVGGRGAKALDTSILFPERCLYSCSGGRWSLEMSTRRFASETLLVWPTSCLRKNTSKLESCTGIKKKKKEPHDSSCVKSMSHTYINISLLWRPASRLGDHYLSTRLLTLLFQHFQKFARKCLPVPGSP